MITAEQVQRSYNGKVGCMCGCMGTYNDDSQSRTFKMAITKINKVIAMTEQEREQAGIELDIEEGNYAYISTGNRCTAVYFKGPTK